MTGKISLKTNPWASVPGLKHDSSFPLPPIVFVASLYKITLSMHSFFLIPYLQCVNKSLLFPVLLICSKRCAVGFIVQGMVGG